MYNLLTYKFGRQTSSILVKRKLIESRIKRWLAQGPHLMTGAGPTEVHILYPKKSQLQNLSTQKNHYFLAYPKKFLNSFFATQKNPSYFSRPKKLPASFINPKKITFGQNFRPKKTTRSPPSLGYAIGAPGVARNSFLARAACAAEVLPLNHGRCTQYSNLKWNTPVRMLRARAHQARARANNDLVLTKSLENLDFDQKYI